MTENKTQQPTVTQSSGIRQFGTILGFELKGCLTNKTSIGLTAALIAIIVVVTFFPRILELVNGGGSKEPDNSVVVSQEEDASSGSVSDGSRPVMLIRADSAENGQMIMESFPLSFPGYQVMLTEQTDEEIKQQILAEEAECAFVMDSLTSYHYLVKDLSIQDQKTVIADETLQNMCSMNAMVRAGMTPEEAASALAVQIEHETVNLGKDQVQNYFYTYIMILALYIVILLYGQLITTNVATEKSSRAMELLITSAKPASMMFGKVIASCLAGLTQLVLIFGSALLCFRMNEQYWGDNQLIASIFDMPVWLVGYMLVFFVLGFLIYAFLYGAIGSTVSKLEDVNTAVMPVTILFIVAFFITMMALGNGTVDSTLMKISSYVPFTSPMAMFTRLAMSTVSVYEIAASIAILIVSVIIIGIASAKIYRVGVLLYGTKMKIGSILKAIKKA